MLPDPESSTECIIEDFEGYLMANEQEEEEEAELIGPKYNCPIFSLQKHACLQGQPTVSESGFPLLHVSLICCTAVCTCIYLSVNDMQICI